MDWQPIALGTRSNPGRDSYISAARLINCYVEEAGQEGKITLPIVAADSYDEWQTVTGGGAIRAVLALDTTYLYVVSGTQVVRFDQTGAQVSCGSVSSSGVVTMARNAASPTAQIAISAGGSFYIVTGTTLQEVDISGLGSGNLVAVTYIDGYFILAFDNGEFFVTAIQDGTNIDSLDFETTEKHPDGLNMVISKAGELVAFGPNSVEFYQNTGNVDFPFERVTSAEYGCYAPGTVVKVSQPRGDGASDTIMLAASNSDGAFSGVKIMTGYGAQTVSLQDLDKKIEGEASVSSIRATSWTRRGHVFYAISGTDWTYCYDLATGQWHELESSGLTYWSPRVAVQFGSRKILGDGYAATLYQIDETINPTLDCVTRLSWSVDGGQNYSGPRSKTVGGSTSSQQRFQFNKIGASKEDGFVFKIELTNAIMADGIGTTMTIIPPAAHAWPQRLRCNGVRIDVIPGISKTSRAKAITGMATSMNLIGN